MDFSLLKSIIAQAVAKSLYPLKTIKSIEVRIEYGIPMYTVSQIN